MLAAVGHPVLDLVRRQIGEITLGTLPEGAIRALSVHEVSALRTVVHRGASAPAEHGGEA